MCVHISAKISQKAGLTVVPFEDDNPLKEMASRRRFHPPDKKINIKKIKSELIPQSLLSLSCASLLNIWLVRK